MAERTAAYLWSMRLLYFVLCSGVITFHLLPIGQVGTIVVAPDVILCLTLAWVVRRPEFSPIILIALIALLADLLLMRVPGLWAALVVLLSDSIRKQRHRMRSTGFGVEWFRVSIGIGSIVVVERIALGLLLVETPPVSAIFAQYLATIAVYPIVVVILSGVFRVRKPELIESTIGGNRA